MKNLIVLLGFILCLSVVGLALDNTPPTKADNKAKTEQTTLKCGEAQATTAATTGDKACCAPSQCCPWLPICKPASCNKAEASNCSTASKATCNKKGIAQ